MTYTEKHRLLYAAIATGNWTKTGDPQLINAAGEAWDLQHPGIQTIFNAAHLTATRIADLYQKDFQAFFVPRSSRSPDFSGPSGRAWQHHPVPDPALPRSPLNYLDPESPNLIRFLLEVPGAHPVWHHWLLNVCHLRDLPDFPIASRSYAEAEYEFSIMAIDPQRCSQPDPDQPPYPYLTPLDVVEQFHGITDEQARRIGAQAVELIVSGRLSPDQDYRATWKEVLKRMVSGLRTANEAQENSDQP